MPVGLITAILGEQNHIYGNGLTSKIFWQRDVVDDSLAMVAQLFYSVCIVATPSLVVYFISFPHIGSVEVWDLRCNTYFEIYLHIIPSAVLMEKVKTNATGTRVRNLNIFDDCPGIHPTNIFQA
jgi:hypothetical protein